MLNQFSRLELLIGTEKLDILKSKKVCVFGIGGVGGNVCDALVRSGVQNFVLVDDDVVSITNINRQYVANMNTIGRAKVEVMKEHILSINPEANVEIKQAFYLPSNRDEFDFNDYDYVVDAIDTVSAKIDIVVRCKELDIPVISAMGCGNKMNPSMLQVTDLSKTEYDPLCKVMRRELRKRGVTKLKVVYSKETPLVPISELSEEKSGKRVIPGSTAFVPPVAGNIIASEVVKDLINWNK